MNKDQIDTLFKPKTFIRVKEILYKTTRKIPQNSDLVIDTMDGAYGIVENIKDDICNVRDGLVVELEVPLSRLIVLESLNVSDIRASELNIIS